MRVLESIRFPRVMTRGALHVMMGELLLRYWVWLVEDMDRLVKLHFVASAALARQMICDFQP